MTELTEFSGWRMVSTSEPQPSAKWIVARTLSLLSHYYQPTIPEGIDELAAADWIAALADLPQRAIDDAAMEWIRNEERRPSPAAIRKRAMARLCRPQKQAGGGEYPFAPNVISEDELRRRREMQGRLSEAYPFLRTLEADDAP